MLLTIFKYWYIFCFVLIGIIVFVYLLIKNKKNSDIKINEETKYIIHFVTNTAETIDDYIVEEDVIVNYLPTLKRNGYYFKGWYIDEECSKQFNKKTPIKSDIVLYAKWQALTMDDFLNETDIQTFRKDIVKGIKDNYRKRNENRY